MRTVPYFHNMIGILTETGHDSASPRYYDPRVFPKTLAVRANPSGVGITVDEELSGVPDARVLYSFPYPGGESHFREPVDYMITGSIAVLRAASDSRLKWLNNIYRMGRDAIEAGVSGTRYYVIPAGQPHKDEAVNLVNVLLEGGIEISRARSSFRAGGQRFSEGDYVIDAAQAFRPYIVDLLEKQTYPDTRLDPSGNIRPPYDIAGWTLPMQMGVEVHKVERNMEYDGQMISGLASPDAGEVSGSAGYGYTLSRETNAAVRAANDLLAAGDTVYVATESFRGGQPGTFIIEAGDGTGDRVDALAAELGIDFAGLRSEPGVDKAALSRPRVGLYKSYVASMDEGWTRWVLEEHGFDVVSLMDADVRNGDLSSLDAIILPHPDGRVYFKNDLQEILTGHSPGSMPEEYTGGIGLEGALALDKYARNGGTILAFGGAVDFALEMFGLPVRDVVGQASRANFSIPGSLIAATVDTSDPLAWGMDENVALNFVNGSAFDILGQAGCVDDLLNQNQCYEVIRGGRPLKQHEDVPPLDSVVDFAGEDLLMSGWAAGTEFIAGKSALARVAHGEGQVIVYGFRPQFRGQPRGTYKLIFNALLNATAL